MAERDLDKINKILTENGKEPLKAEDIPAEEGVEHIETKVTEDGKVEKTTTTVVKETEPAEEEKVVTKETTVTKVPAAEIKVKAPTDLTDDELVALIKTRNIKVPDEKPEDPEVVAERRENEKLAYGLSKGLFNKKEYEQFVAAQNNPEDLVFRQYYKEAKKEDPNLTDEDIQSEFDARYGLDAEPSSRIHKRGQTELNLVANEILKNSFKKIYDADSSFSTFEQSENERRNYERKLLSDAPKYKADVEDVFANLTKISVQLGGKSFEVPIPADKAEAFKSKLLDNNFTASQIKNGWTKSDIEQVALTGLRNEHFEYFASEIAKQYFEEHKKGIKGIVPVGELSKREPVKLTPDQKRAIDESGYKLNPVNN